MIVDTNVNDGFYNLTIKGQNDRNLEIQITTKSTLSDLLIVIDELTKDKESWIHYTVGNTRLILNGAPMEHALITDKYDSSTTLDNIIGLTDGKILTLAQGKSNRNRSREANVDSPAFSNFAQFKILTRNVKACTRIRFDHPEDMQSPVVDSTPPKPMVRDLGEAVEKLSNEMLKWSHLLNDLCESFKNDLTATDRKSQKYNICRKQIQYTTNKMFPKRNKMQSAMERRRLSRSNRKYNQRCR